MMLYPSLKGKIGEQGLPGPKGEDAIIPVGVDVTIIFKGIKGRKGPAGVPGGDGSDGDKGQTGTRVFILSSI